MNGQPACVGRHHLFDSTNRADHRAARAICAGCPVLGWCAQRAEVLKRDHSWCRPLTGTWAGRLYGRATGPNAVAVKDEPDLTWDELKACHAAYGRGERTPEVVVGERIYSRMSKARRRTAA